MNASLLFFLLLAVLVGLLVARFFSATARELAAVAAKHAKVYARAYVKGGALVVVAMIASFDENFRPLTKDVAALQPWWMWAILFLKPIGAGLAVVIAFLDKTVANTAPPSA